MSSGISVHKFGGTSLGDPECYQGVADILAAEEGRVVVVVSAMAGITDALLELCDFSAMRDDRYSSALGKVRSRQLQLLDSIPASDDGKVVREQLEIDLNDISELLRTGWLLQQTTSEMREFISGYGERWSARALALLLNSRNLPAQALDASEFLTVETSRQGKVVVWEQTRADYAKLSEQAPKYQVVTGYVAMDIQGRMTTLGRNGSDYSAAIMASLVHADLLTIWTDVDGVLSADPRRVPEARVLGSMSYDEAFELAYFGAKVIHPQTMGSVIQQRIPVMIRNTFRPQLPGTRIFLDGKSEEHAVKGLSTIDQMAVINIEGTGMIGVPGTAEKVFRALHSAAVSVVMISQGSSEHSICIAVSEDEAERAEKTLEHEFTAEISLGQISSIRCERGLSILALVGDAMAGHPGTAARFLSALGQAGVNVRVIAQGASERNISVAIRREDTTRALRAAHSAFYLSSQTYSVGIVGIGTVGGVLVDQITRQAEDLRERLGVDIRIRAISNSRKMLLADHLELDQNWRETFESESTEVDLEQFRRHVCAEHLPHHVIVDCTSSQFIADQYLGWLEKGIHLVTPNKKANSGEQAYYLSLGEAVRKHQSQYLYETNVGAGLPIIQTLQELIHTGDEVKSIKGIFSGTMAYLFNVFDGSEPFSALVEKARQSGYTEPDPRDDLSGMDVARKLLILAREMGLEMELSDISVESLVPDELVNLDQQAFSDRYADYDAQMLEKYRQAREKGQHLRYIGEVTRDGKARVALVSVGDDDALAHLQLTDNIVQFETARYCENPLVVQGPGAGPEVTAAGVFADLLRVCRGLGARL